MRCRKRFSLDDASAHRIVPEFAEFLRATASRCDPLFCWGEASDEIAIKLGALDSPPSALLPSYELSTIRWEPWLAHLDRAGQHERDRGA